MTRPGQTRRYSPPPSNRGEPQAVRDLYDTILAEQENQRRQAEQQRQAERKGRK